MLPQPPKGRTKIASVTKTLRVGDAAFLSPVPIGNASDCGPANVNAVAITDYDGDRLPDLFVANDWGSNRFYVDAKGLALRDVLPPLGTKAYNHAMGAIFEDFDGTTQWANFEAQMHRVLPQGRLVRLDSSQQIFNAFFTTKTHGTGMGLRISRSIVESRGRLWATDNGPRGAQFCFTLPSKHEVNG